MREKHPVRIIREATGLSQEKFGKGIGLSRQKVSDLETWKDEKQKLSPDLRRRIAVFTGAWIEFESDNPKLPLPPVFIEYWTESHDESSPEPGHTNLFREPKCYTPEHWEKWNGWDAGASAQLRFSAESEPLAFWLVVLIAAGERAKRASAIRSEMLHAIEQIRERYELGPHIETILRSYKPLVKDADQLSTLSRSHAQRSGKRWAPQSRPPRWLLEAIEMEPLRLHVLPPGIKAGKFGETLSRICRENKKVFLRYLKENPARAAEWVRTNLPGRHCLEQLAERIAEQRRAKSKAD